MKIVHVTQSFKSVAREGDVYPKQFMPGDHVTGYAADIALRNGWGVEVGADDDGAADSRPAKAPDDPGAGFDGATDSRPAKTPADPGAGDDGAADSRPANSPSDPGAAAALRSVEPSRDRESAALKTVRAKTTKAVDVMEDGEKKRIAKGAIVEGKLAERLIADGHAVQVVDNKSRGPAPEQR